MPGTIETQSKSCVSDPSSQIQEKKLEETIGRSKENLLLSPLHIDRSVYFRRGRIRTVLLNKSSQGWKNMSIWGKKK